MNERWRPTGPQLSLAIDPQQHHMHQVLAWRGELSLVALRSALDSLIERHSILRTRYQSDERDGSLWALTEERVAVPVTETDLRALEPSVREAQARLLARDIVHQPFDLQVGPLLRLSVLRLSDDESVLVFVVHHSIFDGWSLRVLNVELALLYEAALTGSAAKLQPLPLQFEAFARNQHEWLSSEAARPHLGFWTGQLAPQKRPLILQADRDGISEFRPGTPPVHGHLPTLVTEALRELGRREQCTFFEVTAAAFALLLSEWGRSEQVMFWISHPGRMRPELQGLMGPFADVWPLCLGVDADLSFMDLLRSVRQANRAALDHLDVPGRRMRDELIRIRNGRVIPTAVFNFVRRQDPGGRLTPLNWVPLRGQFGPQSGLALGIGVFEEKNTLAWAIGYAAHLFRSATVERASTRFAAILELVAREPEASLADLVQSADSC